MHITIVTGASRGLGHAIAQLLLERGHHVLTLQRQPAVLEAGSGRLEQWALDLADAPAAAARLQAWIAALPRAGLSSLTLINNAALLSAPGPLEAAPAAELVTALRVGLEAPVLLSAAFLQASADLTVPRRLLNISSGLGRVAMAGAAPYCAIKAGLDNLSRAVALDQANLPHGAKVVSLAPGVIGTDMQRQLRGADPGVFVNQARFAALHAEGKLDSPRDAAAKVLKVLDRADFGANPIADVREA